MVGAEVTVAVAVAGVTAAWQETRLTLSKTIRVIGSNFLFIVYLMLPSYKKDVQKLFRSVYSYVQTGQQKIPEV